MCRGGGASAGAFNHPNRFAHARFIQVRRQHCGALGRQTHGGSAADSRPTAGNDSTLTFDFHIYAVLHISCIGSQSFRVQDQPRLQPQPIGRRR
jgi:hypothetical protein